MGAVSGPPVRFYWRERGRGRHSRSSFFRMLPGDTPHAGRIVAKNQCSEETRERPLGGASFCPQRDRGHLASRGQAAPWWAVVGE